MKKEFRVWNLDREEWAEYGYIDFSGKVIQEGMEYHNYRYEVQQFTGRRDKNRKKVYEGDIVSGRNYRGNAVGGAVIYVAKNSGWYVGFYNSEKHCSIDSLSSLTDLEVVGNIFENKGYR